MASVKIGVDVGGTFTDLVLEKSAAGADGRTVFVHKVPSTPADQSIGVVNGILAICAHAGVDPADVDLVVHGTTVATNITIEQNGAEVGMLTTRGFRDLLHIARHKRPHNFSLHFDVPWQSNPLVKRRNRLPITERIMPPDGRVETPIDLDEVRASARQLKANGVEAVIVCFLFSFLNDAHEKAALEIVREEMPDAFVSGSSEVANVIREFERFSTTAMNAYVGPRTARYLNNLESRLKREGMDAELRIMQSNGGIGTVATCSERPVTILMSGPAGGVIGGRWAGAMSDVDNVITIDIGGTSADIGVIADGQIRIMNPRDTVVASHPVLAPMLDLDTIGAGGGSIAFRDDGGLFRVGPRSAGASPGPACYGNGGTEPTVTDAHVVLGRLDPERFLGGDMSIDPELARKAVQEKIATPFGMTLEQAALGIVTIVNSNMALAIRSNSVARGFDPRRFSLMPFGGAGPLHGVALAEAVSAKDVIVPPAPGITAAMGLLATRMAYEFTRSTPTLLNGPAPSDFALANATLAELTALAAERLSADGIDPAQHQFERVAECRYQGQGFELRAPLDGTLSAEIADDVVATFHGVHERDYGYRFDDAIVEIVTLRVIGFAEVAPLQWPELADAASADISGALLYTRPTTFDDGKTVTTPRYDRDKLFAGHVVPGPAIIIQHNSTTLVPPGYTARVTKSSNIIIAREG
ncbi:hydantoinase/oxoprolinase family protein [Kaistia dalseonensis]|uniref:N-methylhydantoinase A n=1 Tax=Kaistia dalseonensis TaxID=410840 RepID=A0ABU0HB48_9HYPH|nr:hydantoinase/oxoprolinase family protein [Kaistia dalseonensis]MCX5496126.1 hydantoinase/oxoprolinase family protein [Kaistia dalseonensis]MDQ0438734.1 N-methylhydantoinase A [Kaistia dalseonensis]